jgi:exosortase/archaeosortase family protein
MKKRTVTRQTLIIIAIFLSFFPFLTTFNEVLARLAEKLAFYQLIQQWIVPIEVKMVANMLWPLGIHLSASANGAIVVNNHMAHITWNCIGWQSLFLVGISLLVGLQGNYTTSSKWQTAIIGISGAYLINLTRMTFTILLLAYSHDLYAIVYHDVLAVIVTLIFLFAFWWFAFSYLLEEKEDGSSVVSPP